MSDDHIESEDRQLPNPHDRFFKENFSNPKDLIPLLNVAMPKSKLELLDLSTLTQADAMLTTGTLEEYYADLVFNCRLSKGYGEATVCILLEHKSAPDDMVFIQVLIYMALIWSKFRREKSSISSFPVIVPIIVYTGKQKAKLRTLREMFDDFPMKEYLPDFKIEFLNVGTCDSERLKNLLPESVSLYFWNLLLSKELSAEQFLDEILEISERGVERQFFIRHLESLLIYIENTNKTLAKNIRKAREEGKYMRSAILDELRDEGRAEGRASAIVDILKSLMAKLKCPLEDAMDLISLPAQQKDKYRMILQPA